MSSIVIANIEGIKYRKTMKYKKVSDTIEKAYKNLSTHIGEMVL
ncbi:hypothetical protein JOC33_003922 [Thalassobacillus pellis]|nr:hypothetical protein [Thalassobacillus pellis]